MAKVMNYTLRDWTLAVHSRRCGNGRHLATETTDWERLPERQAPLFWPRHTVVWDYLIVSVLSSNTLVEVVLSRENTQLCMFIYAVF